jgi:formiminotetrahydrofolate cyclodeaminase
MPEFATPHLDPLIAALGEEAEGHGYPTGGAVAALVMVLAASLAAAAADSSRAQWDEAGGARAQALALRRRAAGLAQRDAAAYAAARQALARRGRGRGAGAHDALTGQTPADGELGSAVRSAAEPMLELAATAADLAQLAVLIAQRGADDSRADTVIAAMLAATSADAGARLVEVNLVVGGGHERAARARQYAVQAADAAAAAREVES